MENQYKSQGWKICNWDEIKPSVGDYINGVMVLK